MVRVVVMSVPASFHVAFGNKKFSDGPSRCLLQQENWFIPWQPHMFLLALTT